jgi:hypothetical protein
MTILEKEPGLLEALRGEMTPKFLATRSAAGVPNVVPCRRPTRHPFLWQLPPAQEHQEFTGR